MGCTYIAQIKSACDGVVAVGSWSGVIGGQIEDGRLIRVPHRHQYLIVFSMPPPTLKAIQAYELTEGTEPPLSRWSRFT